MTELMKADIFFFVATISVALLTVFLIIVLAYAVRILADIRAVSSKARTEGEFLIAELGEMRRRLHERQPSMAAVFSLVRRVISHYR